MTTRIYVKKNGKLGKHSGKLVPLNASDCCCGGGPCAKCGLPTGVDPVTGICEYLCYPLGPRLYLDFSTSSCDFGDISFSHVPLGVGPVTGQTIDGSPAVDCFSVSLTRNAFIDGGPYFIGDESHPYESTVGSPLDITIWDCDAERAAGLTASCGDEGGRCSFDLNFLIVCESVDNQWTGRYQLLWFYAEGGFCTYSNDFAPAYDYTLTSTKTWVADGAVDLTFVVNRPATTSGCYWCCDRTFMFRVYSDP